jgi:hypothetical protein
MKIAIIFIGLIVQVNQPWSLDNTAVLIAATQHEPRLVIPFQSIIDPDDWLQKQRNGPNVEIDLTDATVRVKKTRGVFCDVKDDFIKGSPSLRRLAPSCKLRSEVRKRQPVSGELAAYVDFRGGRVMPEAYLPQQLSFKEDKKDPFCAVCRARYEADLRGDSATLVYKKKTRNAAGVEIVETHEINVSGGRSDQGSIPEIQVINRPTHFVARHFERAFNIYIGKCGSEIRPTVTDSPCTESQLCKPEGATDPADPGDDCTIDQHS